MACVTTPMLSVRPPARPRATGLGTKPSSAIARSTAARFSALNATAVPFRMRDTVLARYARGGGDLFQGDAQAVGVARGCLAGGHWRSKAFGGLGWRLGAGRECRSMASHESAVKSMNTTEIFLIAMLIIFTVPYLIWRLGRTDYYAPLVVVQIITGILLGPGVLARRSRLLPVRLQPAGDAGAQRHRLVGGDALRLDRRHRARSRRRPGNTAARAASPPALALGVPLLLGCVAALGMLAWPRWMGAGRQPGSSCSAWAWPAPSPRCRS